MSVKERRADVRERQTRGVEKGKKGKKERRVREFKREREMAEIRGRNLERGRLNDYVRDR